ncbi:MAG: hypothetical protein ACKPKO_15940 [Candidatus Fonsibacter sp.]
MVQSVQYGLGTHRLMHISKCVAPLVGGWDIFSKINQITYAILEMHQDLLTSLTKVNPLRFGKKAQLQQAFEELDNKVGLGLALSQGRNCSAHCAMIIAQ